MIRTMSSLGGVTAMAFAVAACGADLPAEAGPTVADSSGVRVVTSVLADGIEPGIVVSPEPLYRIGWDQDDPALTTVGEGFLRPDGSAVFADRGANKLYVISANGSAIDSIGREGEGPGEFGRISALVPLGADSFLVADGGNARVSFYDGTQLVRDARFMVYLDPALYDPIGRHPDGSFWLTATGFVVRSVSTSPAGWIESPLLRTEDFTTLDTLEAMPFVYSSGNENPIRHYGQVFARSGSLVHTRTDRAEVRWLDPSLSLAQIARWDAEPRTLTDDDWQRYVDGFRARNADRDQTVVEQAIRDREPVFGGIEPLYFSASIDGTGAIWFVPYDVAKAGSEAQFVSTFVVVASDGRHLGTVTVPTELRLVDASEDRLLGVEKNELDVEAVVVYEIERTPGG